MFNNPTLFTCPYCAAPEGEVYVDAEACEAQRAEDPDPLCLSGPDLDDPQEIIRFGRGTDRRTPCPHLVHAHGVLEWEDRPGGDEDDGVGTWGVRFDWTTPLFRDLDRDVGAFLLGTPEHLVGLTEGRRPRVRAGFRRVRESWDPMWIHRESGPEYRIDALFFVTSHPRRLRALFGERVRQIKEQARSRSGRE
jgi:hypothetical protein